MSHARVAPLQPPDAVTEHAYRWIRAKTRPALHERANCEGAWPTVAREAQAGEATTDDSGQSDGTVALSRRVASAQQIFLLATQRRVGRGAIRLSKSAQRDRPRG